jgi:hypothetical protein
MMEGVNLRYIVSIYVNITMYPLITIMKKYWMHYRYRQVLLMGVRDPNDASIVKSCHWFW